MILIEFDPLQGLQDHLHLPNYGNLIILEVKLFIATSLLENPRPYLLLIAL